MFLEIRRKRLYNSKDCYSKGENARIEHPQEKKRLKTWAIQMITVRAEEANMEGRRR